MRYPGSGVGWSVGPVSAVGVASPQGLGGGGRRWQNATQSFQSGLVSGLGASSGAVPPPTLGRAGEPVMGQPVAAQLAQGSQRCPAGGVRQSMAGGGPAAAAVTLGRRWWSRPGAGGAGMGGGGALAPFVPPGGGQYAAAGGGGSSYGGTGQPCWSTGRAATGTWRGADGGRDVGKERRRDAARRDSDPDLAVAKRVLTSLIVGTLRPRTRWCWIGLSRC